MLARTTLILRAKSKNFKAYPFFLISGQHIFVDPSLQIRPPVGFDINVRVHSLSLLFPQTPVGRNLRDWPPIWSNGYDLGHDRIFRHRVHVPVNDFVPYSHPGMSPAKDLVAALVVVHCSTHHRPRRKLQIREPSIQQRGELNTHFAPARVVFIYEGRDRIKQHSSHRLGQNC